MLFLNQPKDSQSLDGVLQAHRVSRVFPSQTLPVQFFKDITLFLTLHKLILTNNYVFYICIHQRYLLIVSLRAVFVSNTFHKMSYVAADVCLPSGAVLDDSCLVLRALVKVTYKIT